VSIFVSLEYLLASPLACPFASYKIMYLRNNAILVQCLPFLVISLVLLIEYVHIFSNVVLLLSVAGPVCACSGCPSNPTMASN
jgi:hypothetical protein